jgi:uncharacterized protein (TIGR02246 family)
MTKNRSRAMPTWKYFALAMLAWPHLAGAATPPAVQQAVDSFIAALNGTDPAPFAAAFAPQASITDTLGAFNWQGRDAATRYFSALQAELKADGWTSLQLAPRGEETVMDKAGHAYAAVPLFVSYTVHGQKKQDQGIFTLTLAQSGKSWKITSATWTYTSPPG